MKTGVETIRILLIEDDADYAFLILRALKREGALFELIHLDTLHSSLKFLDQEPVDVILLDLSLPDTQGLETLTHVHSAVPEIPIIVLTGLDDADIALMAVKQGAQDYLAKGALVQTEALVRSIRYSIERMRILKELQHSEQKYRVLYEELKETQSRLIQSVKLASLGEMATGIAHEINQPLASILIRAEGLIDSWERGIPKDPMPKLKEIVRLVGKATVITNHLRVFGRDAKTHYQTTDVNTVIHNAFLLFNEQLHRQNIHITQDLAPNLPSIHCNMIQIEQVLTNLILNARDAMAESVVKELRVRSFLQEQEVVIEVADTGRGISQSKLPQIFDPFFTTKEVGKGTGLGLSISYSIVQEHGGHLTVETQENRGSVFRVELPAVRSNSNVSAQEML